MELKRAVTATIDGGDAPRRAESHAHATGANFGADDPELNRAGALLLAPFEPRVGQAQLLMAGVT